MKNSVIKTVAILKKENSGYNNMETFLKAKGFKVKKTAITVENPNSKEEFYPEYKLLGTHTSTTGKTFNYIIEFSDEIKEDGNKQVVLHLQVSEKEFLTVKPSSNGPLQYMIESFEPNLTTMELPTTPDPIALEPKSDSTADSAKETTKTEPTNKKNSDKNPKKQQKAETANA